MKKVKPRNTKWFQFENPNPAGNLTCDCTIRAVANATQMTWEEAYEVLAEAGRKLYTVMDAKEAVRYILEELNFKRVKIPIIKGKRKPSMKSLSTTVKDKILIGEITKHVLCMKNGKVYDTWDSSDTSLRTFWIYTGENMEEDKNRLLKKFKIDTTRYTYGEKIKKRCKNEN